MKGRMNKQEFLNLIKSLEINKEKYKIVKRKLEEVKENVL